MYWNRTLAHDFAGIHGEAGDGLVDISGTTARESKLNEEEGALVMQLADASNTFASKALKVGFTPRQLAALAKSVHADVIQHNKNLQSEVILLNLL